MKCTILDITSYHPHYNLFYDSKRCKRLGMRNRCQNVFVTHVCLIYIFLDCDTCQFLYTGLVGNKL